MSVTAPLTPLGAPQTPPLASATVVVRVSLDDFTDGIGFATIDGADQPISITTCRQLTA